MPAGLRTISIRGFKSIAELEELELRRLNVLIGANGAGKTNFVDFFRLLRAIADESLQKFLHQHGGVDSFFFLGPRHTRAITAELSFGQNRYAFTLEPTADGEALLAEERTMYEGGGTWSVISQGVRESVLETLKDAKSRWGDYPGVEHYVYAAVSSWIVYHFHDTSMLAPMRRDQPVRDRKRLRPDAANIAAFLLHLAEESPGSYGLIRDAIRLIAPYFDDFLLEPEAKGNGEVVRLEWHQKGSDFPFQPHQLSDGTLRFMCLATALLQPKPPETIVIDEPELGLHPYAITLLAELVKAASERTQVILSTQSPTLLDHFEPGDIIVVRREENASVFERLEEPALSDWLDEYSVGELWQKNVVRGGPAE